MSHTDIYISISDGLNKLELTEAQRLEIRRLVHNTLDKSLTKEIKKLTNKN